MSVAFGGSTPTIRRKASKRLIRDRINEFEEKVFRYRSEIRDFLLRGIGSTYSFHDDTFPFRLGNGGTLPVVRMGDIDYYCLFWREVFPIGWNIANGGSDSLAELLNPQITIQREFREELVVIDENMGWWYAFQSEDEEFEDHPDFALARALWLRRLNKKKGELRTVRIPLKWLSGPDRLEVEYDGQVSETEGWIINICAEDFGIEVDRVVKLNIDDTAVLCDGELDGNKLMNRVIALFEVDSFNLRLASGETQFDRPDWVYHDGRRFPGEELSSCVASFLEQREPQDGLRYGLCPVADMVIRRFLSLNRTEEPVLSGRTIAPLTQAAPTRVFLSFAYEDEDLARRVFEYLSRRCGCSVFFSEEAIYRSSFGKEIDEALESASYVVVVGTRIEHLRKGWVEYEWRSFHQEILSGHRTGSIVPFVSGVDLLDLPRPLRSSQIVDYEPGGLEEALGRLRRIVSS